ncbi:MAG: hypothetical protein HQ564_05240, partial [Candidatus Saganbacteria bacterium]|nr:hypothetical protein [Candidatus Saganbacteria bacterium]
MSRTSAVNWLKSIFTSKSAPAKGLVSIPNSRTPAANLLDSNQQEAYQAFLDAQAVQSSFQTLSAISEDNTAFINLGSEYGGLESASKEGVSFYSPIGFDRCVVATPDQGETALIAKGAGLRSASESYLFTEDIIGSVSTRDQHKPIDVNPSSEDIDLHPLIGGLGYKSSLKEVQGAAALLNLIHGLESGEELGGMILPLAVRRLKKFPIILRGKLQLIKGWNLFTNPDHMTRDQLLNVGTIVREEAKYAGKKITAKVADIFIDRVLYRKRIPRIIRWLVGRTFMKLARPSVYEYVCKTGDFRIGHLHERLVSNGGLDRTEINRELAKLYAIFKQTISLPSETNYDLRTEEGRISYLQQVFSHENNSLAATEICTQIAKETGRQLGILHGAGGHAGGHVYIHQFGEVTLT